MEVWIDAVGFPSHEVSTWGNVRNRKTGRVLKPFADRYGYLRLSLGNTDNVYIHKLVCESFYGPKPEPDSQVNHIDCNRQNNHVLNLQWCSPSENIRWGVFKGNIDPMIGLRRAAEVNPKPVMIVELGLEFPSVKDCAKEIISIISSTSKYNRANRGVDITFEGEDADKSDKKRDR